MITVALAEDQTMLRDALASLLAMERDLSIVGTASNGHEAIDLVRRTHPDVLLTDIEMPGRGGLDLAADVRREQLPTRVIIVTTFARAGYLRRALEAGVSGYLLKDGSVEALANAIRRVHSGLRVIEPELAREAWGDDDPLGDRERRVLRLAGEGVGTSAIAEQLGLTAGTVRNYLSDAIIKLGAENRIEAARIAREKGWL
jgi:two-component system response regulator DesR